MTELVTGARTFLFVPGHRPDRFAKAAASGADLVILDLEDAVAPDRKDDAREHVRAWLAEGHPAVVRVNPGDTPWHDEDVAAIRNLASAVMLPKAEAPQQIEALAAGLPGTPILPLIETALGVVQAVAVCAAEAVVRPAFGNVDLAAQIGVDHTSHEALRHARSAVVLAAAAAGRAAPVDGVTTALEDVVILDADLEHAKSLGFTAKLCLHPRQVPLANRALSPTDDEIAWAHRMLSQRACGSVTVVDGQMVDRPVLLRAQAILARAGQRPPQ
ncbi:CoA ester lyase [Amycolatopsis sp. NBC_00345]|uniref:HpcH/HpaI aldolase/citrate lyase family protein n=1 Tax=Amycolatopsis sp. NBC_00345 TaxID=2975955 RepID=UPI002E2773FF